MIMIGRVSSIRLSMITKKSFKTGNRGEDEAMSKTFGVTGGAGFIGTNFCDRLISEGHSAVILDDLSRPGADRNLRWLTDKHRKGVTFVRADIASDQDRLRELAESTDVIFHLAGQVAVTTSAQNPGHDFSVNAGGTFNLLEAIRLSDRKPGLVYASTNKVYGGLEAMEISETEDRYVFVDAPKGVSEAQQLDFHSPYGCSKGAADQYVRDYARSFGLSTVVLRQSCIYGPRQFGIEDQGWVAWFVIAAVTGRPITLYGTGKQVRDVLFIDDLTDLFLKVADNIEQHAGEAFNIGGGPDQTMSLIEFLEMLEDLLGRKISYGFGAARVGDQPVYVSDIRKAGMRTDWTPTTGVREGVEKLVAWVQANEGLFRK